MKVPQNFGVREGDLTEVIIPNDLRSAKQSEDRILAELDRCHYDADTTFAVKLALEEALTNAIKHGNRGDALKRISVRYHVDPRQIVVVVRDEGPGFRPECVPDPTAEENLERPCGRGLMLMQAYMTSVWYNESGNEVWMLKVNPGSPPKARRPG
jgi:serine/threonine-protein kinase RsbW